jgi:quercetin dioxygenase-like cupin family protein
MKRNQFLLSMLAAFPLAAHAKVSSVPHREGKGFAVKAGEGRFHGHIQLKGVNSNILDVKVSGQDTDGDLAIFEQTGLSPKRGTPLHVHPFQDEIFYVLEGEYYFQLGNEKHHLKVGDSIFLPRKVPHAWTQMSERGKMIVILQPAGKLEEFFVAMASLEHVPTPEEVAEIFAAHEMEVVGPPLQVE